MSLYIQNGLENQKDTLAVFLDVQGAFDNVDTNLLLNKLAEIGCSSKLISFINALIRCRTIYTNFTNETRFVHKGVPQGGVLSPLLYIIYVIDIINNIPRSVQISQFADDICLYTNIGSVKTLIKLIEKSVHIIQQNLNFLGLELCTQKTVLIHFNKRKILPGKTEIKVNNFTIKSSECTRFLGVFFDYKMSFSTQVTYILNKCNKSLNLMKFLRGTWWGCSPETLITIYKSYIRSFIEYGILAHLPRSKKLLRK